MYSTAHPVLQPHAPYSQCQGRKPLCGSASLVLVLYYCMYLTHTPPQSAWGVARVRKKARGGLNFGYIVLTDFCCVLSSGSQQSALYSGNNM